MKYIKGLKYQLAANISCQTQLFGYNIDTPEYSLTPDGILTGKKWFAWDGCTWSFDTDTNHRAGLFHDIGCLMVARGELLRETLTYFNALFKTHCKEDGMWAARAWWHFEAITKHFANNRSPDRRKVITLNIPSIEKAKSIDEWDNWL
jgi:hypothetical protein